MRKNTPDDWAKYQLFYNAGNSWRKVCEQFGLHNKSITLAVRRGDLVSRTRGQSISLAMGGSGISSYNATCQYCVKEFSYQPAKSKGIFCSNRCKADYVYENKTIPRILAGEGGHHSVRQYLLMTDPHCSECGQGEIWNNKPLSLHLDHRDGNSDNNQLTNVRILCPHCHSQTDNFGIKNKGQRSRRNRHMLHHRQNMAG